jgi:hypothetical protein
MKASVLSIQQPWSWAIVSGFKHVENRTWKTSYRGRLLIHAGKREDLDSIAWVMQKVADQLGIAPHEAMASYLKRRHLGAIVGEVDLWGVTHESPDPWFFGPYGLLVRNPKRYRPIPLRGHLGINPAPAWLDENLLQGDD